MDTGRAAMVGSRNWRRWLSAWLGAGLCNAGSSWVCCRLWSPCRPTAGRRIQADREDPLISQDVTGTGALGPARTGCRSKQFSYPSYALRGTASFVCPMLSDSTWPSLRLFFPNGHSSIEPASCRLPSRSLSFPAFGIRIGAAASAEHPLANPFLGEDVVCAFLARLKRLVCLPRLLVCPVGRVSSSGRGFPCCSVDVTRHEPVRPCNWHWQRVAP